MYLQNQAIDEVVDTMKPIQIAKSAVDAMIEPGTLGVTLVIPKGKMPRGFPRGELLNEIRRDGRIERTYSFDPWKVLSYLVNNGLIELYRANGKEIIVKPVEIPDVMITERNEQ